MVSSILHSQFLFPKMTSLPQASSDFGRKKLLEFPHVSLPHKDLMLDLITTTETRLHSALLPCSLPSNVQFYQNHNASSQGTLHIRCASGSATPDSDSDSDSPPLDFILASWLHCALPSAGELNITSLSGYLNACTDAPNFLFELIRPSPSSLVLVLDLLPRQDIVLHPDYLKTFYEDTQLDQLRVSLLSQIPEATPYFSASLYLRSAVSPTAIFLNIQTDGAGRVDDLIREQITPVAKQVLSIWLDHCVDGKREVDQTLRESLKERDAVVKKKTIEIDLGTSLPRLFGPDVADQVLCAVQEVFARNA